MMTQRPSSPTRSIIHAPWAGPEIKPLDRAPNWTIWRYVPELKIWEAIALSLGVEPTCVKLSSRGWMVEKRLFDEGAKFEARLLLAERNSEPGGANPFWSSSSSEPADRKVKPGEFAAWLAQIFPNDVAPEFLELIPREYPRVQPNRTVPARIDHRSADQPLLEEMRSAISDGRAKNATDAARLVDKRAEGSGNSNSKVTRLTTGYHRWIRSSHD